MARRTAISAVLAVLTLLASAACSSSGADKGSAGANPTLATDQPHVNPTLATVPAPTTTTNPYAVPAVIDAAYVNRVLAGLDAIFGDATRTMVRTKTITADVYDRLRSIYGSNELLQLVLDLIQDEMRSGFTEYKSNPGNKLTTVNQIVSAGPTCIFVRVQRDYTAVALENTSTGSPQWVALKRLDSSRDPKGYNLTMWAMIYDGFPRDRSQPANPCTS